MIKRHDLTNKIIGLWLLFGMLCLLLVGCGGGTDSGAAVELPLAQGKPTFLFFWTDN